MLVAVDFLDPALRVDAGTGKEARAMEVQVWRKQLNRESVDRLRVVTGDVLVAQMFAHYGGILALDKGIVVTVAGARFGEFDVQLVEHFCHQTIDVFRPIIGVKAPYDEREELEQRG